MAASLFEDSDRRCPRDGKRMILEIGQRDVVDLDRRLARVDMVHSCLECGYVERDNQWRRPRLTTVSGPSMRERLYAMRWGEPVPFVYDDAPFPPSEFDEESSDA